MPSSVTGEQGILIALGVVLLAVGMIAGFAGDEVDDSTVVSVLLGGGLASLFVGVLLRRITKLTLPGDIGIELSREAEKKIDEKAEQKAQEAGEDKAVIAARATAILAKEYWGRTATPGAEAVERAIDAAAAPPAKTTP